MEIKNKIIDAVCYNGEKELFEIRYNILKDYVDEFIVVEFDKTFSGQLKPWRFIEDFKGQKFKNVCYHGIEEDTYSKYKKLAENSPNTKGAEHWKTEFIQKESIKDALEIHHLKDDDIVFVGDCDEIWNPEIDPEMACFNEHNSLSMPWHVTRLEQIVYTYYLNNRSSEKWRGTSLLRYKNIKDGCLNHLRTIASYNLFLGGGWHFTSLHHQLEKKLTDSYTEEDYAHPRVLNELQKNIESNKDFLGRNFTYKISEENWPPWLKENREKYLHLLK